MHARGQIKQAVATAVTGLATTSSRVFVQRTEPLQDEELPALLVYSLTETSSAETIGAPRLLRRTLQVMVEAVVKAQGDTTTVLDQIAVEVETAIAGNVPLNALVKNLMLESSTTVITGEGELPASGLRLQYAAEYMTREGAPETIV